VAITSTRDAFATVPRERLATLPTPLEDGGRLPGGATLLVKRDDLTGLGLGGNKARKLELLCGAARAARADVLVSVGAAQSNHARMTAAAGARLGLETHLVLGGRGPTRLEGNQLLARLFGARLHHAGTDDWDELAAHVEARSDALSAAGRRPFTIPLGGSTPAGCLGFAVAWGELLAQCERADVRPAAVVHASSTGGTHAGLLAGAALASTDIPIVAVDVAKGGDDLAARAVTLARGALDLLGRGDIALPVNAVEVDRGATGAGYAQPTPEGDAALRWAARRLGLVLDRTYTAKAFAALLAAARRGRFGPGDAVVFWHTGGHPAVFATGGVPPWDVP
jgi:1-aminocyclopropane-1-carboxylate deaminase/D-cysteine desulfhydrase-like pyridoxal-dependent ACC family enzyme